MTRHNFNFISLIKKGDHTHTYIYIYRIYKSSCEANRVKNGNLENLTNGMDAYRKRAEPDPKDRSNAGGLPCRKNAHRIQSSLKSKVEGDKGEKLSFLNKMVRTKQLVWSTFQPK